jgi:NAD(P)-dependent dehydrogenase (short-subunit alcohol dehydrogenase family)
MSKLANILWSNELQRRLSAEGLSIIVISVHPGSVNTFVDRVPPRYRFVARLIMTLFFKTWDQGAYNSAIAAASPVVRQNPDVYRAAYVQGDYGKVKKPTADASNPEAATELWEVTSNYLKGIGVE